MSEFPELWDFIVKRSRDAAMPVVQDRTELEYVFNLLKGCESYLEVGTAEGNSLYVLANALPLSSQVVYIDYGEKHTEEKRKFILDRLTDYDVTGIHADSNDMATLTAVKDRQFDAVLIDAGHDDFNVAIDALYYGPLAKKYVIFHDIQLPDVDRVFNWYCKQFPNRRSYRVVNSETYGYGIVEVQ